MTTIDIGGTKLGPTASSRGAATKLSQLAPLRDVEKALDTLSRGQEIAAKKSIAQQETKQITDQLRVASRKRRQAGAER
ncbi:hypothetical protein ACFFIO_07135 [Citricoccus parietis]|uniref:Uncharacterized protein n=1 Tax=Citricoccus parietis TaxID=592307 RepID=A0ABV6F430_9MICC